MEQNQHDEQRYTEEHAAWFEVLGLIEQLGRWRIVDWQTKDSDDAPEGFGVLHLGSGRGHR